MTGRTLRRLGTWSSLAFIRGVAHAFARGVALALALAGCAPHLVAPPPLDRSAVEARFHSALRMRRDRGAVAEGEWSLWARAAGAQNPPGVSARMLLEAPDALRLRVNGLLGTALDAAVRGDSLVFDAPSLALSTIGSVRDSASREISAGSIACRSLAATWQPPEAAWRVAAAGDSGVALGWRERADSVELSLDREGLPAALRLRLASGGDVRVRYLRWQVWGGVPWPARVEISDAGGRWRVLCQVESLLLRAAPPAPLVTLRARPGAIPLSDRRWKRLLERLPQILGGFDVDEFRGEEP